MTKKRVDSENVDNYSILGIIFYANRRIYSILIIAEYFNNDRFFLLISILWSVILRYMEKIVLTTVCA